MLGVLLALCLRGALSGTQGDHMMPGIEPGSPVCKACPSPVELSLQPPLVCLGLTITLEAHGSTAPCNSSACIALNESPLELNFVEFPGKRKRLTLAPGASVLFAIKTNHFRNWSRKLTPSVGWALTHGKGKLCSDQEGERSLFLEWAER